MPDNYRSKLLSSLVKVFSDTEPVSDSACNHITALKNETVSFQIAITKNGFKTTRVRLNIESPIKEMLHIRSVENVPCQYPAHAVSDDNYLRLAPGLYPDILRELDNESVQVVSNQWKSVWVDAEIPAGAEAGLYPVKISFSDNNSEELCSASTNIMVYDAVLPDQKLIQTQWFHCDCISDYYGVEVFSAEFWQIAENFMLTYVKRGFNMILTPVFTPPLDTAVGGERKTVQLVDVTVASGVYSFNFSKLEQWVKLCQKCGIKYFEISHLFTQWGAKHAPKIMAVVNGEYKRIFGWETDAQSLEYTEFLHAFLGELTCFLEKMKIADLTYFHISDEPNKSMLESYAAAKSAVARDLKRFNIIDAVSDFEFYESGLIDKAVCSTDHIHVYLDRKIPNMWSYYCTSQWKDVSNRFISMPAARTRIYGLQLYKYDIEGTLHWGYNFYNSQYSLHPVDPYRVTDAECAFPSGDAFIVYPAPGGKPEESLRLMYLYQACADHRALQMLESLTSREYVINLIDNGLSEPLTFCSYPKSDLYLISLRNKINEEISHYYSLKSTNI